MKLKNNKVTAEVTPHHLFFNDEDLMEYDTNLKVGPPIRAEKDRLSLIEAVKDGTIDCIATDHAPHTLDEKKLPYGEAPSGMPGVETSLTLMLNEVSKNKVKLENIDKNIKDISLDELPNEIEKILKGNQIGRVRIVYD